MTAYTHTSSASLVPPHRHATTSRSRWLTAALLWMAVIATSAAVALVIATQASGGGTTGGHSVAWSSNGAPPGIWQGAPVK